MSKDKTGFITELSESIRKILQDRREARAVELAKAHLRANISYRAATTKMRFINQLDLETEIAAATTKEDIYKILKKLNDLTKQSGNNLINEE